MNTTIVSNRVLHSQGVTRRSDGTLLSPSGASGIYIDNQASGNLVQLNIVSDSSHASVKINGGSLNKIYQNILTNAPTSAGDASVQLEVYSFGVAKTDPNFLRGNEFYMNQVAVLGANTSLPIWLFSDTSGPSVIFSWIDGNLYWRAANPAMTTDPHYALALGQSSSLADWMQQGFDEHSGVASQNSGLQLASDGTTALGNAAGGWTEGMHFGPGSDLRTGLRASFGSQSSIGICLEKVLGTQYAPMDRPDPQQVLTCLRSK